MVKNMGHIYVESYSTEIAAVRVIRVMYLAMCLLTGKTYKKVEDAKRMSDRKLVHSELVSLKYLRKVNLEAYSYLIQLDNILEVG